MSIIQAIIQAITAFLARKPAGDTPSPVAPPAPVAPEPTTRPSLTAEKLARCTGSSVVLATRFLPFIVQTIDVYNINTPLRQAAFLAQIGHESGGLRYTSELWGPTPAQTRYEGRADLGNTQPGDGSRFRGHGLIQITGRSNHARVRDRMRKRLPDTPDFEDMPSILMAPQWAALSAGDYWDDRKLNALADQQEFEKITLKINGGLNGYDDRLRLYNAAREVLV